MTQYDFRSQEEKRYQQFANSGELVLAAPQTIFFGGEHSVIDGGLSVLQHIDRYVFCAVSRTSEPAPRVCAVECVPTLPSHNSGIPEGYDLAQENLSRQQLLELIGAACERFGFPSGLEIRLMTEGFPASGANTSGAIAATVAGCLLWASGVVSRQELGRLRGISPLALARAKCDASYRTRVQKATLVELQQLELEHKACFLNDLAWVFDAFSHGGKASGYGAVAGWVHSPLPFCYFPERRSPHPGLAFGPLSPIESPDLDCRPFDLRLPDADSGDVRALFNKVADNVFGITFAAFELTDVMIGKKPAKVPFTWGVVHSGCTKNTGKRINEVELLPMKRWHTYQEMRALLERGNVTAVIPEERTAFHFLGRTEEKHAGLLRDPARWEMVGLATEILPAMCMALEGRGTRGLAEVMRRNEGLLEAASLDWYEQRMIASAVYRAVPKRCYNDTAVKLTGGGAGGCVVFVAPPGFGRQVESSLEEVRSAVDKIDVISVCDNDIPDLCFGPGLTVIARSSIQRHLARATKWTRGAMHVGDREPPDFGALVGRSPVMKRVYETIGKVAQTRETVLIRGESGTGKELAAGEIHRRTFPAGARFVPVICSGFSELLLEEELFGHVKGSHSTAFKNKPGLIPAVEGGTLFLDEVGAMGLAIQAKVLRVLNDKEYRPVGGVTCLRANVRFVAATNEDLERKVREGAFLQALLARLKVLEVWLPTLQERGEDDIRLLVRHLIHKHRRSEVLSYISLEAMDAIVSYPWPSNVRELENAVVHATVYVASGARIEYEHLPPFVRDYSLDAEDGNPVAPLRAKRIGAVSRKWAGEAFAQLLCAAFEYTDYASPLSRGRIFEIAQSEGFLSFVQSASVDATVIANTKRLCTEKRFSRAVRELSQAGWLDTVGRGSGTRYLPGKQWPGAPKRA